MHQMQIVIHKEVVVELVQMDVLILEVLEISV